MNSKVWLTVIESIFDNQSILWDFVQVGVIDISSRLALSTVANYPGVTEVMIKDLNKIIKYIS